MTPRPSRLDSDVHTAPDCLAFASTHVNESEILTHRPHLWPCF